jgi:hypothetical protein
MTTKRALAIGANLIEVYSDAETLWVHYGFDPDVLAEVQNELDELVDSLRDVIIGYEFSYPEVDDEFDPKEF